PSWVMPWMNSSLLEGETIRMRTKIRLAQQGAKQAACQGAQHLATSCLRKSFKKVRARRQDRCRQAKRAFYLLYKSWTVVQRTNQVWRRFIAWL
ncbi:hypothetical protein, partial [Delftia acidovorans]|uniref:hypothetical protein n=1 Tax=Delftia acidovorans TaxID=80866 RepID=UPI00359FF3A5